MLKPNFKFIIFLEITAEFNVIVFHFIWSAIWISWRLIFHAIIRQLLFLSIFIRIKFEQILEQLNHNGCFEIVEHQFVFGKNHVKLNVFGQNIDLIILYPFLFKLRPRFIKFLKKFN
jgi:hypothetical protein